MYSYKRLQNRFFISVNNGVEVVTALRSFCEEMDINAGSISGIGAVKQVVLRFFDPQSKEYVDRTFHEQMEIASLVGNISQMNEEVYLHLHITLGRADYTVLAGHLMSAQLNGAGEFIIEKSEGELNRYFDENAGLNKWDF